MEKKGKEIRAVKETCEKEREIKYVQENKGERNVNDGVKIYAGENNVRKKERKIERWRKAKGRECERMKEDVCKERKQKDIRNEISYVKRKKGRRRK